jgi:hypothetical protein
MTHLERLSRAAECVRAVKISPRRWAHYAYETHRWYVLSATALASLCDYQDNPYPAISQDAYSHWCAGTSAREMPEGWSP